RQAKQNFWLLILEPVDRHLIDLLVNDDMAQAPGGDQRYALVGLPRFDGPAHRLPEAVAAFRRRLVRLIAGVDQHRNHRNFAAGYETPVKKAKRMSHADFFPQTITPGNVELLVVQRAN